MTEEMIDGDSSDLHAECISEDCSAGLTDAIYVDAGLRGLRREPLHKVLLRWVFMIALCTCICVFTRYTFQIAIISGSSMTPTLYDSERYLTLKHFDEDDLSVGKIVCFNDSATGGLYYIKRIVAVPGDTVEIRNGVLYVNGIKSEWQFEEMISGGFIENKPYELSESEYFMLGDNRNNSQDSRTLGAIPFDDITNIVIESVGWNKR